MRDIKYKSTACGPAGSFQPGDLRHNVPDAEAEALVSGGYAVDVTPVKPAEQAVAEPAEQAVAEPAEQAVAEPAEQAVAEPAEQAVAEPAEQAVAEPAEQAVSKAQPTRNQQRHGRRS